MRMWAALPVCLRLTIVCGWVGLLPGQQLLQAARVDQQQTAPTASQSTSTRGFSIDDGNQQKPAAGLKGNFFALVIGINDYRSLPPLKTAVSDAQTIAKILSDDYGFQVKLLLNASRDQITGTLNQYRRELDANSNLLIYYAGHGYQDKAVNRFYWLPVDAEANDNSHWIIADEVTSDIKGILASHVLVVSDSCYSGTMRDADISFDPQDRQRLLEKMMEGHSRDLLASGGNEPVSDSGGSGHSVFAAALIRGLTSEPDKVFSGDDLFERYIRVQVGGGARQTPQYGPLQDSGHSSGDFVFERTGARFAITSASAPAEPRAAAPATPSEAIDLGPRPPPVAIGSAALKSAILSLDVDSLKSMTAAGLQPTVIEDAFRQLTGNGKASVAQQFFENTTDSAGAIVWLDAALASGLDPNMTVPSDYFEREGILAVAMRAGNLAAAKALLHRGASPHAFEDLFLTAYTAPRFLFPLEGVVDDDRFSMAEKQDLTKAFLDAGVAVPEALPAGEMSSTEMHEAEQLRDDYAAKLGMKLMPSAPCCKQPGPICKNASSRTGIDWCAAIAAMPRALVFASTPGQDAPFYNLSLQYLLTIERNDAYFLGRIEFPSKAFGPDYVLVEVSKDASSWSVLKYMSPEAGMGLCKKDDKNDDGPRPEWCWRKISLYRVAGTDQMRSDSYEINWKVSSQP